MTLNAAIAVKTEIAGATMYGRSTAFAGKKLSLRMSLIRSAIGWRLP